MRRGKQQNQRGFKQKVYAPSFDAPIIYTKKPAQEQMNYFNIEPTIPQSKEEPNFEKIIEKIETQKISEPEPPKIPEIPESKISEKKEAEKYNPDTDFYQYYKKKPGKAKFVRPKVKYVVKKKPEEN